MAARKYLALDSGTTNTRVWLIEHGAVIARTQVQAGVRDTSRTGSAAFLKNAIRDAIGEVLRQAGSPVPELALAAGMIGSELGLAEVPHLRAPVGIAELAGGIREARFPEIFDLTFRFIPGVRVGPFPHSLKQTPQVDLMRGEETEICGALRQFALRPPLVYLHAGSHTKAARVDRQGRIAGGMTTLTGELMLAVRKETILSQALQGLEGNLLPAFVRQGALWSRQFGFARSLFQLRILQQTRAYRAAQLESIFYGSAIGADLATFERSRILKSRSETVVVSGQPTMQLAWRILLRSAGYERVKVLSPEKAEAAFLRGLRDVALRD